MGETTAQNGGRESSKLKRELGVLEVFAISSGAMISSGLFILPAVVYLKAGPSIILAYILAAFWLINVLRCVMRFVQSFLAGIMIERGLMDLRVAGFRKALRLPMAYYDIQGGSSDAASRFIKDVPTIKRGMNFVFTQVSAPSSAPLPDLPHGFP